jgi:hypothetical protein
VGARVRMGISVSCLYHVRCGCCATCCRCCNTRSDLHPRASPASTRSTRVRRHSAWARGNGSSVCSRCPRAKGAYLLALSATVTEHESTVLLGGCRFAGLLLAAAAMMLSGSDFTCDLDNQRSGAAGNPPASSTCKCAVANRFPGPLPLTCWQRC